MKRPVRRGLQCLAGFLAVWAALTLPADSLREPPRTDVRLVDGHVFYSGPIDDSGRRRLLALLTETGQTHFYIQSPGGSAEAGLGIGAFVVAHGISVTAVDECHSACANYVFLPSRTRRAAADARIGLHGGYQAYASRYRMLLASVPHAYASGVRVAVERMDRGAAEEKRLLSSAGVDPAIIVTSAEQTLFGPVTHIDQTDGRATRFTIPGSTHSPYNVWFPPEADYAVWGLHVDIVPTPPSIEAVLVRRYPPVPVSRASAQPTDR